MSAQTQQQDQQQPKERLRVTLSLATSTTEHRQRAEVAWTRRVVDADRHPAPRQSAPERASRRSCKTTSATDATHNNGPNMSSYAADEIRTDAPTLGEGAEPIPLGTAGEVRRRSEGQSTSKPHP